MLAGFWVLSTQIFLSTLSLRRATLQNWRKPHGQKTFLSTLSLRRATLPLCALAVHADISIHALLAESDWRFFGLRPCRTDFYPRSPCGERRVTRVIMTADQAFLSTLSLRRATRLRERLHIERIISIHALLAESDSWYACSTAHTARFLSTLSLRRATLIRYRISAR